MGEARIVRSGHFRIDPRRALEKLRRFRFAHPAIFLDEWVRCAVVSGASRVRIEPRRGELAILFDGRPLSKPELEDPWSAALEGEGRARDLALGLVAVLALEPAGVRVQSGGLCLAVDGLGPVSLSEAPRERDSRIVIEWSAGRADESWRARIKDAERFALAACELESPAGPLSKPRPGAQALAFERGGLRGWIEPRRVDATPQSVVRVFRCGVLVEALGHPQGSAPGFAGAAVSAWVNDDRAETDASLERLRRDSPRLRGLSRLLERRTRDLGAAVGRWHA
ncbi:MAG: hypothetical protein NTX64_15600, partial [Elusimicrobia bacterium]|nr:hypothetical protein [Elusimicrobiota bacterium]